MSGEGIKQTLTSKLGPLPVYLWVGLLVVVAAFYFRTKGAGASSGATTATTSGANGSVTPTSVAPGSLTIIPVVIGAPSVTTASPVKPKPKPAPKPAPKPKPKPRTKPGRKSATS